MEMLLGLLAFAFGIGSLICFIMVLVKMFQNGQTGLGIVCIVVCCIGGLVAFIYGWMKSAEWELQNVMLVWTGCIIAGLVIQFVMMAMGMGQVLQLQEQFQPR